MGTYETLSQPYRPFRPASKASEPRRAGGGPSGRHIVLVHAKDHTGHIAYYFLQVNTLRLPQLQHGIRREPALDLESYGDILASGYGEAPEEIREDIRLRYGWSE